MISIEKTGKTVEDAVQAGLRELQKESSDVTIDVLEYGSPGLFGMFGKLARVKLTVKESDPEVDFEMPVFSLDQQAVKRAKVEAPVKQENKKPQKAQTRAPKAPKAEAKPAAVEANKREATVSAAAEKDDCAKKDDASRAPRSPRPPRKPRAVRQDAPANEPRQPRAPIAPASMEDLPVVDEANLTDDERTAYEFLKELTGLMNVTVEIRVKLMPTHLSVQMLGDTLGVLIGRRGETLDAMQYLTSLQVNKGRAEYLRVTLDTEYYRAKREEALKRLAERMANRVKKTGHRMALEPMNPYERRVLHSALQDHAHVTTHSEGEEPYRRVVITLK